MSGSDEVMADDFGSENEYIQTKAYLSEDLIEKMRHQLKNVIVPKGVTRLPSRIGTTQNGKLKANEWSVIFEVYLPLIVLDLLWDLEPKKISFLSMLVHSFSAAKLLEHAQ
ncbi:hypothetical protein O181_015744 [Austropuccinia psidii MF-1]|uniref:Uncharacterized protein n=1 Tax=Austropuccinia psidii MF-1 TaxID=1389203 RepID=A0A9Q3C2J8_9BASI|nr:hypothetical protein [Austropuccinia psidii MF-1]